MSSDAKKENERSVEAYLQFGGLIKHASRYLIWLPEAKALREEKRKFLSYFTLPGRWAWDIFFFEKNRIIERRDRGFPNVRFCDRDVKSYSDAKRLLGSTIGKKANFEEIVLAHNDEFWGGFPYDLYNLDFSGTCFPNDQPPFSDTFEAITRIIENHASEGYFPFVIFLTMKASPNETNKSAKEQLKENIETNRGDSNFSEQINQLIPNTNNFVRSHFVDFIIISIPKLICHLANAHCIAEVRSRAKYFRRSQRQRNFFITKFIFRFTRRRRSLRIRNNNYIENITSIMRLDNVKTISPSSINSEIIKSRDQLQTYINSLNKVTR